jgi:hypothetical protein
MISTYHDTTMEKVVTVQKGGQQKEILKLVCVLDYRKYIGGVDRSDQYCVTYSFIRISFSGGENSFSGAWKCAL